MIESAVGPGALIRVRGQGRRARFRIAPFPPIIPQNPYQRLLYQELAEFGLDAVAEPHLKIWWLWRFRREVQFLHFHWPQGYYTVAGSGLVGGFLCWVKLALYAVRLLAARVLGYKIVWTIHEFEPHERRGPGLDRTAALALAHSSHLLLVHDRGTLESVRPRIGCSAAKLELVPHGSYVGVYPRGRSRSAVRKEMSIGESSFVFLCFGHVRAYKGLDVLLDAFAAIAARDAVLVIAGLPMDEQAADAVRRAAASDRRIKARLEFIPDDAVGELFGACDVVVAARGDGGTSGVLVLALSLGLPVIAARAPTYGELMGEGEAGWFFEAGDPMTLTAAFEAAAEHRELARTKGCAGLSRVDGLRWDAIGERTAQLLEEVVAVGGDR